MKQLAVVLLVAGCAHAPPSPLERLAATMVTDVAQLRGLPEKKPVRIEVLEPARFMSVFRRRAERERRSGDAERQRAVWVAFGFAPPSLDVEKLVRDVLDEQVAGFYDTRSERLFVRARAGVDANDRLSGMILAHEIEHALQDQHFGMPTLSKLPDEDARLGRLALYEGDATALMLAWAAQPEGLKLADTLQRATKALEVLGDDAVVRAFGRSPQLGSAPPILRALLTFPYFDGMKLVGELFRAGGFALVDQMFAHPPQSTEQVLHVDKYLAGEPPVPVKTPAVPSGWRKADTGQLGELGVRVLLSSCVPPAQAHAAAAGWGGDSFVVVRSASGLALLWATAWDDEAAAERFEAAVRRVPACWPDASHAGRYTVAPGWAVKRRGNEVTLVRGFDDAELRAEALLGSAGTVLAAAPPLGAVKLAPPPADADPSQGHIEGRRWSDEQLGLGADLPEGFGASSTTPGMALMIFRKAPTLGFGAIQWWRHRVAPDFEKQLLDQIAEQFATGLVGVHPREENHGEGHVAFGDGRERSWSYPGSARRVRASVLPVCDGAAALVFVQVWEDTTGERALDDWLSSVKPLGKSPPGCPR